MMNAYFGFYTSRPFWAGDPIDLTKPETKKNFTDLMSQVQYSYEDEGYKFEVCKDGMLMFQISSLESEKPSLESSDIENSIRWWARYLNYANCLHLLIDSSIMEHEKPSYLELFNITNKDAFRLYYKNRKLERLSISNESFMYPYQMLRYPAAIPFESALWIAKIENRISFPKSIFDLTVQKFSSVVKNDELVEMLAGIVKSIAEYKVGNYSISLILSWFVIESKLNQKWLTFINEKNLDYEDGSRRINSERIKRLKGRDYPISVILNFMELSDILPFPLFKDIDIIRGYRNNVVHREEGYICNHEHCKLAIQTALKLAMEDKGFNITPNLNLSIRGA